MTAHGPPDIPARRWPAFQAARADSGAGRSWIGAERSGFVQQSVEVALDDVAGWGALLAEALRQTGGTLSEEERAWADGILGHSSSASTAA